jgi:glycerol-3-phosphate acyltransferase PlsY
MWRGLFIAAVSYLLGSIPFGYLLVRIFRGEDVRRSGSGNIGATNVSRKSPTLGVLTLILDALKGAVAVRLAIAWIPQEYYPHGAALIPWTEASAFAQVATWGAGAAMLAVIGHLFPVWLNFRGGKGVATGLGGFLVIAPKAVLAAAVIFVLIVIMFRYISLGSIIAVAAFPAFARLFDEYGRFTPALVLMLLTSLLIIAKHHANIRRLLSGTENRFGSNSGKSRPA